MAEITKIELNKTELSLEVGATEALEVIKTPEDGEGTITWTSTDNEVATVDNGTVTAVAAGTATIKASAGEGTDLNVECAVTVSAVDPTPDPEPDPEPEPETEEPDLTFLDDGKIPMGILYVDTVEKM